MKILTLWQPWASLIALGLKQYETRSWGVSWQGKLAIHAAKRPLKQPEEITWFTELAQQFPEVATAFNFRFSGNFCERSDLPLGCIVAIADLASCVRMMPDDGYAAPWEIRVGSVSELEKAIGDWKPGRYAWKLENIHPLDEPIPYKGGQGLRGIEDVATLTAIAARIGGTTK